MLCNVPTPLERRARKSARARHPGSAPAAIDSDVRPDPAILAYAVTSMLTLPFPSSPKALLGPDAPLPLRTETSAERLVDASTPPTFLWHTAEDAAFPVTHALHYAQELMLLGV